MKTSEQRTGGKIWSQLMLAYLLRRESLSQITNDSCMTFSFPLPVHRETRKRRLIKGEHDLIVISPVSRPCHPRANVICRIRGADEKKIIILLMGLAHHSPGLRGI